MKKLRWQIIIVVLALAAIGIILIGQKPPSLLPEPVSATVQPSEGGAYSEALVGSFGRLNPVLDYYNDADRSIDSLIYSSLIRFDDRGSPYGDLVDSWGISRDGKVYNFSIRPEAVWHDGQPVTSDDIIFTIDLLRSESTPIPADLREFWSRVEVLSLDDKTLQFRLPEPFAPFLDYLTFGILPQHLWQDVAPEDMVESPNNLQPVGSGPFAFDSLLVEDGQITGVVLKAFDNYYGKKPYLSEFKFEYYPDAASALEAYKAGDALGIGQISRDILGDSLKQSNLGIYTSREPQLGLMYMNLDKPDLPFFQNADIRRALLMGINRQRIIDQILGGQAILADGPILPGTWAYYDGIERLPYDSDFADQIIKEAGYTIPAEGGSVRTKEGVRLAFELVHPDQEPYPRIAQMIKEDLAKLGIQVDLLAVPYDQLLSDYLETGNYQAALVDLNLGRTPDPDPYPFWHQTQIGGGQNYARWDDRQASEFLEQARVQVEQDERAKRYRNFQVRFTNQMPALPLYYLVQSFGVDNQVQGVRAGPLFDLRDRFNTVVDWFMPAAAAGS